MSMLYTLRKAALRALRQIVGPLVGVCVVGYFAYHTVHGDRGLVALTRLQDQVAEANATLAQVSAEKAEMQRRADMLRPDNLDPDLLEERSRAVLNYSHPDELIILLPRRAATQSTQGTPEPARSTPDQGR